jgi:hypothetical protein
MPNFIWISWALPMSSACGRNRYLAAMVMGAMGW